MNYWTLSPQNIYVAAHRGWSSHYPENTLLAFEKALELGVDQLETDLHLSADGELVLIHDTKLDRTTNGTGPVCEQTLAQLKQLDAGSWKGEQFAGLQIPTFIEFMELVKDHPTITLDVELKVYPKDRGDKAYEACDKALAIIDQYGFTDRVVINSWSGKLNDYIFQKYGTKYRQHLYYPVHNMHERTLKDYSYGYCVCMFHRDGVKGKRGIADLADCNAMRAMGLRPWAGTAVKDLPSLETAIASQVELITCNDAKLILELLREKGLHK